MEVNAGDSESNVLERYDLKSFIEMCESDINSGRLTAEARFNWETMLDIARESPPFTTVEVVEDEKGDKFTVFVEPKVSE